jgi:hypothetical protein
MTTVARKVFSFATMMVRAQKRHEARVAAARRPDPAARELALRRTLQKMNGTKRLVVFMYPA